MTEVVSDKVGDDTDVDDIRISSEILVDCRDGLDVVCIYMGEYM